MPCRVAEPEWTGEGPSWAEAADSIAIPLELDTPAGRLSLISTVTVFGTAAEVTLSELALGRQGNGKCSWDGRM